MDYHAGTGTRVDDTKSEVRSASGQGTLDTDGIGSIGPISNIYSVSGEQFWLELW